MMVLRGVLVFTAWFFPAALGISLGRRAATPGNAFGRAFLFAFGATVLMGLGFLGSFARLPREWSDGLFGIVLFALPPALVAGLIALVIWKPRAERRTRLSPALELAARARFHFSRWSAVSNQVQAPKQEMMERQTRDGFRQGTGGPPGGSLPAEGKSEEAVIEEALELLQDKLADLPAEVQALAREALRDEMRKQLQQMKQD